MKIVSAQHEMKSGSILTYNENRYRLLTEKQLQWREKYPWKIRMKLLVKL